MKHGTKAGYNRGCRGECCRAANRAYMREYRQHTPRIYKPNPGKRQQRRQLKAAGLPADWTW